MKYIFIFQILFFMSLFNPGCSQEADQYAGVYTNRDIGLVVEVKKSGKNYTGFFELQKQRYAFTGTGNANRLEGYYDYGGKKVQFIISGGGNGYNLNSEGFDIAVQRSPIENNPDNTDQSQQSSSHKQKIGGDGKRLSDPYGGYSFAVPQGWTAKEESGNFTLLSDKEQVGFSIVPHNFNSLDEMTAGLQDIRDESSNTHIKVTARQIDTKSILFRFEGSSGGNPVLIEILSTLSPYGGGVSFVGAGQPQSYSAVHTQLLNTMAASAKFSRPKTSAATQQWISRLSGKQLIYLNTSGGGSERITITLNPNGEFTYSNNSSYLSSGGGGVMSYAGRDAKHGSWKILSRNSQNVLVLFGDDQSTREYVITPRSENGEINLNDRRYFLKSTGY